MWLDIAFLLNNDNGISWKFPNNYDVTVSSGIFVINQSTLQVASPDISESQSYVPNKWTNQPANNLTKVFIISWPDTAD